MSMWPRISSIEKEVQKSVHVGLFDNPEKNLREAMKDISLSHQKIFEEDLHQEIFEEVLKFANNVDGIAAIRIYTRECKIKQNSLYKKLNDSLRDLSPEGIENVKCFIPFVRIMTHFLKNTRNRYSYVGTVWRGVPMDLGSDFFEDTICCWPAFSSCTLDPSAIVEFLGDGPHTIFEIETRNGFIISAFSFFSEEQEVLLLPGAYFKITAVTKKENHCYVYLTEIDPPLKILLPRKQIVTQSYPNGLIFQNLDQILFLDQNLNFSVRIYYNGSKRVHAGILLQGDFQSGNQSFVFLAIHNRPDGIEFVLANEEVRAWGPIQCIGGPLRIEVCKSRFYLQFQTLFELVNKDSKRNWNIHKNPQHATETNCCFFVRRFLHYLQLGYLWEFDYLLIDRLFFLNSWFNLGLFWFNKVSKDIVKRPHSVVGKAEKSWDDPNVGYDDSTSIDIEEMDAIYNQYW